MQVGGWRLEIGDWNRSLLAVAVGLLLGMLFETAQEMGLWVGIPLLVSLVPMTLMDRVAVLPAPLPALIPWIPTVAAAQALLVSFSGRATVAQVAPELAIVLACARSSTRSWSGRYAARTGSAPPGGGAPPLANLEPLPRPRTSTRPVLSPTCLANGALTFAPDCSTLSAVKIVGDRGIESMKVMRSDE